MFWIINFLLVVTAGALACCEIAIKSSLSGLIIFIILLFLFVRFIVSQSCLWEKEMAAHSSIVAWRILWTEDPGGLLSIGSNEVGHNWSDFACMHWRRKCNPLQYSCLENPRDRGAWWAAIYGVSQSRTQLKWLSSSSSSSHFSSSVFTIGIITYILTLLFFF